MEAITKDTPPSNPFSISGEVIAPSRYSTTLFILGGVAVVTILANVLLLILLRDNNTLGAELIQRKWELLLRMEEPKDILILGDSSANQGIVPGIIERELGKSSVNLATVGDLASINDVWMLEEYMKRFGPPESVVVVHAYDTWERPVRESAVAHIPLELGFWKNYEVEAKDIGVFSQVIHKYVPLYSRQRTLRKPIVSPVDNDVKVTPVFQDDGFMVMDVPFPNSVRSDSKTHIEFTAGSEFSFSELNASALQRLVDLSDEHDFQLYLAHSPLYEGLQQSAAFVSYYDDVTAALKAYADSHPNVHFIFERPVTFPADEMQNADHVIASAANTYTELLASEIASLRN